MLRSFLLPVQLRIPLLGMVLPTCSVFFPSFFKLFWKLLLLHTLGDVPMTILNSVKLTKTISHHMCAFIFPYNILHLCSIISLGLHLPCIKNLQELNASDGEKQEYKKGHIKTC